MPASTRIADLDHVLALALRTLVRRDGAHILEIHLDLFQGLSKLVGMGWLFGTSDQAGSHMQDLPERSAGAGQRDLCGLQLGVTGKGVEQSPGPRHTRSAFSGGAKRISTIFCVTRTSQRK